MENLQESCGHFCSKYQKLPSNHVSLNKSKEMFGGISQTRDKHQQCNANRRGPVRREKWFSLRQNTNMSVYQPYTEERFI